MKTRQQTGLKRLWQYCIHICLVTFAISGVLTVKAQEEPTAESSDPVLISQTDSTRALATTERRWRGELPKAGEPFFQPGADSRAIIFATNIGLTEGEDASALRVYAEDESGKIYRLTVESIEPLRRQSWIYAVRVKLYDENGYNGQPIGDGDVLLRLTWRGLTSNRVIFGLGANGGNIKNDDGAAPTPAPLTPPSKTGTDLAYNNAGDRARFMEQAAFGPNPALDLRLRQIGAQRWIQEQFGKQPTFAYPNVPLKPDNIDTGCPPDDTSNLDDICRRDFYSEYPLQRWMFNEALYGNDQLRRRVAWALHQIWVVSGNNTDQARWQLEYMKVLDRNAFGNYRNLMGEMTLNPAMGNYLDMVRSTRRSPNENYPREILQLFNVGLDELNVNGTPKLSGGNRIPTYDQDKIVEFTKVFTGWTRCESGPPACPNDIPDGSNYIDPMVLNIGVSNPSDTNQGNHDLSAKSLFNYSGAPNSTIAACANCTTGTDPAVKLQNIRNYAADSLNKTLDNIYNHPNVAPFVSKLLIQHLVTSDPTPAYVARVATVFNNNRPNPNQLAAVVTAILLDAEARGSRKTAPDYGKLREPFQLATNVLRQFKVRASGSITVSGSPVSPPASCGGRSDGYINPQTSSMGQNVWNPTTVFSYFSPEYVVPGTDMVGPEFGILDTGTAFRRINFINTLVYGQLNFEQITSTNSSPNAPCGTSIDLTEAQNWSAADASGSTLVEGLNRKMMYGFMSVAMKQRLSTAIAAIPATATNADRDRARQAVYLVATSSQYQVQR